MSMFKALIPYQPYFFPELPKSNEQPKDNIKPSLFSMMTSDTEEATKQKQIFVNNFNRAFYPAFEANLIDVNDLKYAFYLHPDRDNAFYLQLDIKINQKKKFTEILEKTLPIKDFEALKEQIKDLHPASGRRKISILLAEPKIFVKLNSNLIKIGTLFNRVCDDSCPLILDYCKDISSLQNLYLIVSFDKFDLNNLSKINDIEFYDLVENLKKYLSCCSENVFNEVKQLIAKKDVDVLKKLLGCLEKYSLYNSSIIKTFESISEVLLYRVSESFNGDISQHINSYIETDEFDVYNVHVFRIIEKNGILIHSKPIEAAKFYEKLAGTVSELRYDICFFYEKLAIKYYAIAAEKGDKDAITKLEVYSSLPSHRVRIHQILSGIYAKSKDTLNLSKEHSKHASDYYKEDLKVFPECVAEFLGRKVGEMSAYSNNKLFLKIAETELTEELKKREKMSKGPGVDIGLLHRWLGSMWKTLDLVDIPPIFKIEIEKSMQKIIKTITIRELMISSLIFEVEGLILKKLCLLSDDLLIDKGKCYFSQSGIGIKFKGKIDFKDLEPNHGSDSTYFEFNNDAEWFDFLNTIF